MTNTIKVIATVLLVAIVCEVASATLGDTVKSNCLGCFKGSPTHETADEKHGEYGLDGHNKHTEGRDEGKNEKKGGFMDKALEKLKDKEFRAKATYEVKKLLEKKKKEEKEGNRYDEDYDDSKFYLKKYRHPGGDSSSDESDTEFW